MFHRMNVGDRDPYFPSEEPKDENKVITPDPRIGGYDYFLGAPRTGLNQTAVRDYVGDALTTQRLDLANQNQTDFYLVKRPVTTKINSDYTIINKKEDTMNSPEQKDQTQPMNAPSRVDIPGNNFQRPGAAMQPPRPAYPGMYPGASQPANMSTTGYESANAAAQAQNAADNKLVIGSGITLSGEIESCDHLIVQGTVEASLKGAKVLDIAEQGAFFGTVEIEEANIAGRFEGDITVNGRLTVESTGLIIGTITYKELAIEAGATIDGAISPIGSQGAAKKMSAPRAKKITKSNDGELPFAEKKIAVAE